MSLRDQLFDRIYNSLLYVGKSATGENIYSVEWKWKDTTERYFLGCKDINYLVSDILDEHPRCWEYRKATIALMNAEIGIVDPIHNVYRGPKAWLINCDAYYNIRAQMMDLHTPTGKHIFDGIVNIGPNPTQGLHKDILESKRLASLLINKCWRTKKDFDLQIDPEITRNKMIEDILSNPIKAMQNNTYVYSALKEHSGSWK